MNATTITPNPATKPAKAKNECAKMRPKDKPYEVWKAGDWTWNVLKKWQTPEKEKGNPFARWFCNVVTPMTGDQGEMGDVYVHEIMEAGAVKIA